MLRDTNTYGGWYYSYVHTRWSGSVPVPSIVAGGTAVKEILVKTEKEKNMNTLRRFIRDERGIELSEYVVALGLILIIAFAAIIALGNQIVRIFNLVAGKLTGITT